MSDFYLDFDTISNLVASNTDLNDSKYIRTETFREKMKKILSNNEKENTVEKQKNSFQRKRKRTIMQKDTFFYKIDTCVFFYLLII